jgi:hypothetical protein
MIKHLRRQAVANGRRLQLILAAMTISFFAGCGGGTTNVQNPPPPLSSAVSIAFQPAPPTSISLNSTAAFTAVVSNDPTNAGVDWSLLCKSGGNCGALSSLHTASGNPTTYTPPQTISGNSQAANVVAFATADHAKNIVSSINVTGFGSSLKGRYVFQVTGTDNNGASQLAGVIDLDGSSAVTSGEQTHCDVLLCFADPISGGSYSIGSDGRGTLTLNTGDPNIGQQGPNPGQQGLENFSLVVLSSSQALIATLDDPNLQASGESSAGTMDLQTSATKLSGGYAFVISGTDIATASPTAFGGVLNVDSPRTISGAGSLVDQDLAGTVTNCPVPAVSGTVSDPDSFGMVTFNLTFNPTTCAVSTPTIQLTGYLVDAVHIKLIESDNNGSGTGSSTAGIATSQGAAAGTFTNNKSFAGKYVFGVSGDDVLGVPSSLASVGRFTADASGNLNSGFNDEFLSGLVLEISGAFKGTYTLDSTGSGRVDSFITFSNASNPGAELIFYLTGNGNPPLVLDANGDANSGPLGVGAGVAYPQVAPPYSFNGRYGLDFAESGPLGAVGTGQMSVNATLTPPLSGVVDTNLSSSPNPNSPLTGTFRAIPSSGHFTGTLSNTFFIQSTNNTFSGAFYLIDSGHGFFIETDSQALFLGYFAPRTPVCQGCP